MKARLDSAGRLVPPASPNEGRQRLDQLDIELGRVERQLGDENRVSKFPTRGGYDAWRGSALRAKRWLETERRLLTEWLTVQPETDLLRSAHALLSEIRTDGGLNPGEETVVQEIDEYFARLDGPKDTNAQGNHEKGKESAHGNG